MVLVLLEATHDEDRNDALDPPDPDGQTSSVNGIFPGRLAEHVLLPESLLVPVHLVVHEPRTHAPPQYRFSLPGYPDVIVRLYPGPADGVEEEVVAVRKRDVHDCGEMGQGSQAVADRETNFQRIVGREMW